MKKTTKHVSAAKSRGLLMLFALIILSAPHDPAIAQTVASAPASALSVILNDFARDVVAGPEEPPTVQDVLLTVCENRGYGEDCARTLLGMAWKESNFISTAIGDQGKARGWFQIHFRLHKISIECAEDLACSADWTIDYLERNRYPKYVKYAVQCHNGCNIANGYAASALRHGQRLWNHEEKQVALAN